MKTANLRRCVLPESRRSPTRRLLAAATTAVGRSAVAAALAVMCLALPGRAFASFLYALNDDSSATNTIYGFEVDENTGALTALAGFPVDTGDAGSGLFVAEGAVVDLGGARLYVLNGGANTVAAYDIDRGSGALTETAFSPIALPPGDWGCLTVHPSGSPLVVGDSAQSRLASFLITDTTATLAGSGPYATSPAQPYSCAFSRDGAYVYTGGTFGSRIAGFAVDAVTAELTALTGSPFDSGQDFPAAYATDDQGRLFEANSGTDELRVFTTTAGIPTVVSSAPFSSGLIVEADGLLHPAGFYVVSDRAGSQVGVYAVSGSGASTTLAPVAGSPFATGGAFPQSMALNRGARFLYVANGNSRNITTFTMSAVTGVLSAPSVQAANTLGAAGRIIGLAYMAGACGDDVLDPGEQCDGIADEACPGVCRNDCTCANPFLCYRTKAKTSTDLDLEDVLDSGIYSVRTARDLCTPAAEGGDTISDPAAHLMLNRVKGPHVRQKFLTVTNELGSLVFDTKKADSLLTPTAVSVAPDPAPTPLAPGGQLDSYRCVKVKRSSGSVAFPRGIVVTLDDEFGSRVVAVRKPTTLCVPTDVAGAGVANASIAMVCYKIKTTPRTRVFDVQTVNPLGSNTVDLKKEHSLCLPSVME